MNFARHALAYAKRGKAVFPVKPGGKQPMTEHGLKDATTDRPQIATWACWWPEANVGLPTGAASNFWVLDVDADDDGEATLWDLQKTYGALPETVEALTGGGGRHIYFAWRDGQMIRNSARKLGPGLDVRGEGGYVVAPPSVTTGRYEWSVDCARQIAPAPEWLLELVQERPEGQAATPPQEWRGLARNGVVAGSRNQSAARLAGHLLRRHVDFMVALELVQAWNAQRCSPPLHPSEVERTVASIGEREAKRREGEAA